MVGKGSRKEEGSFTVTNSNVFAALESLRKKKKLDKERGASKRSNGASKSGEAGNLKESEEEKQVYWAPAPLTAKSWADVDDEDDDDYYATTAPPQAIWGRSGSDKAEEMPKPDVIQESESEDELVDEGDDDAEEEHDDHETDAQLQLMALIKEPLEVPPAPKEAERQLSKRERRKKELAELEAILADFGVNPKDKSENERSEALKENGDADKNDNPSHPAESKTGKKKKKKDKAAKDEPDHAETSGAEPAENNGSSVDVKDRLKKVAAAPAKKKKSNKEMDGAARAVALEAAARSAKLAAAKKKEKSHYNQQPTR